MVRVFIILSPTRFLYQYLYYLTSWGQTEQMHYQSYCFVLGCNQTVCQYLCNKSIWFCFFLFNSVAIFPPPWENSLAISHPPGKLQGCIFPPPWEMAGVYFPTPLGKLVLTVLLCLWWQPSCFSLFPN